MLFPLVLLIIGFVLLVKGADFLVDGSSSLAARMGVSSLIVGLTVVALGTSMPELVVNVFAAVRGTADIAIGNILGSNMANITLGLGAAAILFPMRARISTVWKEIPFALLAAVLIALMASDVFFDGAAVNILSRVDGLILLSFAVIFVYYIFGLASASRGKIGDTPTYTKSKTVLLVLVGMIMLVAGGKLVIDGAVSLATSIGMSERLIGLTVIAIGTSLPELVTSFIAAYKKQVDMAIGTILGTNILNVFLVLGLSATIQPIPLSPAGMVDAAMYVLITLLLFFFMFIGKKFILQRWQGIGFVVMYFGYMGYNVFQGFA